jgi:hypothetical protein
MPVAEAARATQGEARFEIVHELMQEALDMATTILVDASTNRAARLLARVEEPCVAERPSHSPPRWT